MYVSGKHFQAKQSSACGNAMKSKINDTHSGMPPIVPFFQKREDSSYKDEMERSKMKDDSNDTPFKPGKLKAKVTKATKTILLDDPSDDDIPMRPQPSSNIQATNFDDAMDASDEVAAIAYALAESTKTLSKQKQLKNDKPKKKKKKH
jgi:hypothetical protein